MYSRSRSRRPPTCMSLSLLTTLALSLTCGVALSQPKRRAVTVAAKSTEDDIGSGSVHVGVVDRNPSTEDLKICSVLGGLDLTRLRSLEVRGTLSRAVEDVELVREVITESMYNGGLRGGLSNLTALASTLDWRARRDRANHNLTENDTTVTAGLGWTDDRWDRRVERYVPHNATGGEDPSMKVKQVEMEFVDTLSNILPWILDRRSREDAWFVSHPNGRSEGYFKEPLPYERLYDFVSVVSLNGAMIHFPPYQKAFPDYEPVTFGDFWGGNANMTWGLMAYTPPGWPFTHEIPPGGSTRDALLAYPYIKRQSTELEAIGIAAVAPIYFAGKWGDDQKDEEELVGATWIDVTMSAIAWVFDDLEDGLCEGSFAVLADVDTFNVIAISESVARMIYPENVTLEDIFGERVDDGSLKGGLPLNNNINSSRWDELRDKVQATERGGRDHLVLNLTLTNETVPREYYVMFDRWASVAEYAMLVFAPVEEVHGAIKPVLSRSELSFKLREDSKASENVTMVNEGILNLTVSIPDRGWRDKKWMMLVDAEDWENGFELGPGESVDVQIHVDSKSLKLFKEYSETLTLIVEDAGYPDCANSTSHNIRVSVQASPKPSKNQLGGFSIFGIVLCVINLGTATACVAWVVVFRKVQVVRSSQPPFLILLGLGCFVMGSALIPLSIDDGVTTVEGASAACMAVPWLFFMGFVTAFSALFSKIWRINKIFHQPSFKKITVKKRDVIIPFAILFLLNFLFLLCWTLIDPVKFMREGTGWGDDTYGHCYAEGEAWGIFAGLIALTNLTALVLACFQAYQARDISDEFSESKYISITLGGMLQVLIIGIPVLFLVDAEPVAAYFVKCMIVFLIAMSVLLLIFVPKMVYMSRKNKMQAKKETDALGRVMKNAAMGVGVNKTTNQTESETTIPPEEPGGTGIRITHFNKSALERQLGEAKGQAEEFKNQVELLTKRTKELTEKNTKLKAMLEQYGIGFEADNHLTRKGSHSNVDSSSPKEGSDAEGRNNDVFYESCYGEPAEKESEREYADSFVAETV